MEVWFQKMWMSNGLPTCRHPQGKARQGRALWSKAQQKCSTRPRCTVQCACLQHRCGGGVHTTSHCGRSPWSGANHPRLGNAGTLLWTNRKHDMNQHTDAPPCPLNSLSCSTVKALGARLACAVPPVTLQTSARGGSTGCQTTAAKRQHAGPYTHQRTVARLYSKPSG